MNEWAWAAGLALSGFINFLLILYIVMERVADIANGRHHG